jgi:hypothetical protein
MGIFLEAGRGRVDSFGQKVFENQPFVVILFFSLRQVNSPNEI